MKKFISILSVLVIIISSCTEQPYYEIPLDENGNVYLTDVSSTTSTGISTLDESFTVTATLPNAKSGDVMMVELLKLQTPAGSSTTQLLPLEGTQKQVTVDGSLKASVTYSRTDAQMSQEGDYATVVFNGATDYAKERVNMVFATSSSKPKVGSVTVDVARTSETAYFEIQVDPKSGTYSGNLVAKRKNGTNADWVAVEGSPFTGAQPFMVPISGDDFATDNDTMYYSFTSAQGSYTDEINTTIIVRDPYLFIKRTSTLILGGSSAGSNLIKNTSVAEDDPNAMVAVAGSLILGGGSGYLAAGKTIEFVEGTADLYDTNNATNIIAAFNAGTPTATADPIAGNGYFIFKAVTGTGSADVYYGMIKMTNVTPGASLSFEYKIGDQYAHLSVIE